MLRMDTVVNAIVPQYATLLCGKNGLKRMVTNIHTIEDIETATFIRDNELIFITGVALGEVTLTDLINKIVQKHIAGIILNTGCYIKDIPSIVKEKCENQNIPLISLPWKYILSDLQKIIFKELIASQYKEEYQSYLLEQLLHRTRRPQTNYPAIFRFQPVESFCIAIIRLEENFRYRDDVKQDIKSAFSSDYIIDEEMQKQFVLLFHRRKMQDIRIYSRQLDQCLQNYSCTYQIGLSQICAQWEQLPDAYDEAQLALTIAGEVGYTIPFTVLFQDMTLLKIIKSIPDSKLLEDFVEETLGKIIAYDEKNNTDCLTFLQMWLKHNGNPSKIARDLYIHRNTVAYRINKIKSILGYTEITAAITSQLFFAFLIRRTLNK